MKNKKGFTLIELLAVIVILGLIMILVIPSVVNVLNKSKKDAFYLYAQSMSSKVLSQFLSDDSLEINKGNSCYLYRLKNNKIVNEAGSTTDDDDSSETADDGYTYEGFAKITKQANSDGQKKVVYPINNSSGILYVKYCLTTSSECEPDKSYPIEQGSTKVTISKALPSEKYNLCFNYQYQQNGQLIKADTICSNNNVAGMEITDLNSTYDYVVYLSITNGTYKYEGEFDKQDSNGDNYITKNNFSAKLNTLTNEGISITNCDGTQTLTAATSTDKKQSCSEPSSKTFTLHYNTNGGNKIDSETVTIGSEGKSIPTPTHPGNVTTTETTTKEASEEENPEETTEPTTTKQKYQFLGWYYDKEFKNAVTVNNTGSITASPIKSDTGCITGYNDITLYAKWSVEGETTTTQIYIETTTTTTTPIIETTTTTTVDISDNSILLNTLNVSGYNIDFSPLKFYYTIDVPYSQESLSVSANPAVSSTKVTVSGNDPLAVGTNNVLVQLESTETGKTSTYTVKVNRYNEQGQKVDTTRVTTSPYESTDGAPDPTLEESNASLRSLIISGYDFSFSKGIYEYDLIIREKGSIDVIATSESDKATVVISDTKDLKAGDTVTVTVTSQNGYYKKIYKIHIKEDEEKSSTGTKILRVIAIVLGVILIVCLVVMKFSKSGKVKVNAPKKSETTPTDNTINNM